MPTYKKKTDFFATEAGIKAKQDLDEMEVNLAFNTEDTYSANALRYPSGVMSFSQKHMDYLRNHPNTNPDQYIANLRLITRKNTNRN